MRKPIPCYYNKRHGFFLKFYNRPYGRILVSVALRNALQLEETDMVSILQDEANPRDLFITSGGNNQIKKYGRRAGYIHNQNITNVFVNLFHVRPPFYTMVSAVADDEGCFFIQPPIDELMEEETEE